MMRPILSFLVLFLSFTLTIAQESIKRNSTDVIHKLEVQKTVEFGSEKMKFVKVIEDSRCPTDTNCIWAGELKILIEFYNNNSLIEEKEFVFGSEAIHPNAMKLLRTMNTKSLYAYTVSPYPSSKKLIDPQTYCLEFIVR